jgi:hypothetical protein
VIIEKSVAVPAPRCSLLISGHKKDRKVGGDLSFPFKNFYYFNDFGNCTKYNFGEWYIH